MAENARIGPVMWLSQFLMILLTAGVVWLLVVDWAVLQLVFIVCGCGGLCLILTVAAVTGSLSPAGIGVREITVAVAGLLILALVNLGLFYLFDVPMKVGPSASAPSWYERVLVNTLFAIYEENFMFGVYSAGKAAGLPDVYIIICSVIVFIPLHAWVAATTLVFAFFIGFGRAVISGAYAASDHSDPGYLIHIFWNVLNS